MKSSRESQFHDPARARVFLENWNQKIEYLNGFEYIRITVQTSFGDTRVWAHNPRQSTAKTIVFFPGARTCGLFWDMDNALAPFKQDYQLYIVDVNGQPSLSGGHCPDQKTTDYGVWATEVLDGLGIERTVIVGASLGGLICMKLCLVSPGRIERALLLNPAGIQSFSMARRNVYYNVLPMLFPTKANLSAFLDRVVFCPPTHQVPPAYRNLISDYLLFALRYHTFRGDYPAPLRKPELQNLTTAIYLIVGQKDPLFPPDETIRLARKSIPSLRDVHVLPNTAHGIETSKEALGLVYTLLGKTSAAVQA